MAKEQLVSGHCANALESASRGASLCAGKNAAGVFGRKLAGTAVAVREGRHGCGAHQVLGGRPVGS